MGQIFQIILISLISIVNLLAQNYELQKDTISDIRDGKQYEIIEVDNLIWFTEDLRYETNNSFKIIQENKVVKCFYTNDQLDSLCPSPYRIPTAKEWELAIVEIYDVKKVSYKKKRLNKSLIFKMKMDSTFMGDDKLKIQRSGWIEGGNHIVKGTTTYWLNEKGKPNYHLHFGDKSFSEHTHRENINDVEEKRRQFLVRCVCEKEKK